MSFSGKRSKNAIQNQLANTTTRTVKHNAVYVGIVKDNADALKMNRLRVWIPELTPDSVDGLYTVNWCSPFAGATPVQDNNKTNTTQTSYGFWVSPPDINNEVVVMFVNGDPNRGIYIGGLYQQDMNHMVPGIPSSTMTEANDKIGSTGPVSEYNRKNNTASSKPDNPERPGYNSLVDALVNQGLGTDDIRGTSTSGARRDTISNVAGILTQGGNQFVMDDDESNTFIRFRTPNGSQILISDTVGVIYMITKSGNSWLEISDDGIEAYTTGNYSVRCHGDYNVHADGDINLCSGKYTNVASFEGISISAEESFNLIAANKLSLSSGGQLSLVTTADLNLQGSGDIGVDSGGTLAMRACAEVGITACDTIGLKAATISQNSKTPAVPSSASQATVTEPSSVSDRTVSAGGDGTTAKTKTIVSILPTHEPYAGHPSSNSGPATITPNDNITTASSTNSSSTTSSTTSSNSTSSQTNSDNWMYPITGTILDTFLTTQTGVDIIVPFGQSAVAPRKGKVLWAGDTVSGSQYANNGTAVVIDHYDGTYSLFGGLSGVSVEKGKTVIQGQTIGKSGIINYVSKLHFEIKKGGQSVDPGGYYSLMATSGSSIIAGVVQNKNS